MLKSLRMLLSGAGSASNRLYVVVAALPQTLLVKGSPLMTWELKDWIGIVICKRDIL